ncbi:MAG: GNAT family N-acetyltransferase [Erysipelotrichaceae bacterium]|nr:GNAT family N-acetyltransferase [Erysipelotrichaceae bacterium]
MSKEFMIELIGYLGSLLVLISFITTSVVKLRIINTIGSIIFTIYAIIIKSYPTAIMNAVIIFINIHYLYRMLKVEKEYEIIRMDETDSFVDYFIRYNREELDKYFDVIEPEKWNTIYVAFADERPVGLTAGVLNGDTLDLYMDFTRPEYRDFSIGDRVFRRLSADGIKKVIFNCPIAGFEDYLKKFSFNFEDGNYIKSLGNE